MTLPTAEQIVPMYLYGSITPPLKVSEALIREKGIAVGFLGAISMSPANDAL